MNIYDKMLQIENQDQFVEFLVLLLKDLKENTTEWENSDLESFIKGMIGYCSDKKFESLEWKKIGEIFLASRVYE